MSIDEEGHPDRPQAKEQALNELDLRALPKVELHRHLEGAIRLSTIIDLSREAGVPLPADTPQELAAHALIRQPVNGLEEALARFAIAQNSVRSYEAVSRISFEAVEDLAAENVRLAELRFSPEFMCAPGGLDWDGAMEAVLEGVGGGTAGRDMGIGLVAIFSRDFGMESAAKTVAFALRHRRRPGRVRRRRDGDRIHARDLRGGAGAGQGGGTSADRALRGVGRAGVSEGGHRSPRPGPAGARALGGT